MTEERTCGRKEKQEEKMNSEPFIGKQRPEGNTTDIWVTEFRSVPVPNKEINKASLRTWSKHMVQSHTKNRHWRLCTVLHLVNAEKNRF